MNQNHQLWIFPAFYIFIGSLTKLDTYLRLSGRPRRALRKTERWHPWLARWAAAELGIPAQDCLRSSGGVGAVPEPLRGSGSCARAPQEQWELYPSPSGTLSTERRSAGQPCLWWGLGSCTAVTSPLRTFGQFLTGTQLVEELLVKMWWHELTSGVYDKLFSRANSFLWSILHSKRDEI